MKMDDLMTKSNRRDYLKTMGYASARLLLPGCMSGSKRMAAGKNWPEYKNRLKSYTTTK